ncbi:carboxypeptidase-like regulatory domain-containing protein, partial [Draconibacterium orientale]
MNTQKIYQSTGRKLSVFFTFLFLFAHFFASGQVLSGRILDEQKQPVPYATIYISETRQGTTSNTNGDFSFNLPSGNFHLTVRSM